jgi:hypothetical protein
LDDHTRNKLRNCVLPLSLAGGKDFMPIGVMFFVTPNLAVTANHNIASKKVNDTVYCQQRDVRSHSVLTVVYQDSKLDIAILSCGKPVGNYLSLLDTRSNPPQCGINFILAAYQIGITEELEYDFKLSFGIMTASVTKTSDNHMVFQSTTFAGDSGAALTLVNGNVIGIHVEGVNEAEERLRGKKDFEERLNAAEESIDRLIENTAQGCIGVLAHVVLDAITVLNK